MRSAASGGRKNNSSAILALGRQINVFLGANFLEKRVRHLNQDAAAIAGIDLATACAAMIQIQKHRQCLIYHSVRLLALYIDDESHAACFMFELWVVKTLRSNARFFVCLSLCIELLLLLSVVPVCLSRSEI